MKKILSVLIASLVLLIAVPSANVFAACSYGPCGGGGSTEERITLGSYTLTKAQTKEIADNMKALSGAGAAITATAATSAAEKILTKYGYKYGPYVTVAVLAASLSGMAVADVDIIYAAKNGKRVKISITDSKNYHTSYSIRVIYEVVN
ncbi:hypothetical protein [Sporosarcina sp. JAI121]|uniref:hypothetical protein n=1 Tax=Sporosarcina sp. JAI121 TaxID=2723064 RepID=UPI0015C95D34|nr:hypothetical protein [Sporosarcina sp. JAI121]NYF24355.1 putative DNA-binding transcriptional regulator YafY [Sporosarcina sp. JAI121]